MSKPSGYASKLIKGEPVITVTIIDNGVIRPVTVEQYPHGFLALMKRDNADVVLADRALYPTSAKAINALERAINSK